MFSDCNFESDELEISFLPVGLKYIPTGSNFLCDYSHDHDRNTTWGPVDTIVPRHTCEFLAYQSKYWYELYLLGFKYNVTLQAFEGAAPLSRWYSRSNVFMSYLAQHYKMASSTRPKQSKSSVSCLRTSTLVLNLASPSTASKLTLKFSTPGLGVPRPTPTPE